MDPRTIKQLQEAIGNAVWNLNYFDFCRRLGKAPDSWTEDKWAAFKALASSLHEFDPGTLAKIIAPMPSAWTAEEILRQEG